VAFGSGSSGADSFAVMFCAPPEFLLRRIGSALRESDLGVVTAEFAVLLPVAVAVLVLMLGAAALQLAELQAETSLSGYARELELGISRQEIGAQAAKQGQNLSFLEKDGFVCLQTGFRLRLFQLNLGQSKMTRCSLQPGN